MLKNSFCWLFDNKNHFFSEQFLIDLPLIQLPLSKKQKSVQTNFQVTAIANEYLTALFCMTLFPFETRSLSQETTYNRTHSERSSGYFWHILSHHSYQ